MAGKRKKSPKSSKPRSRDGRQVAGALTSTERGALRPSHAPIQIHATAVIKDVPKKKTFPVRLSTLPTTNPNVRWHLRKRGSLSMLQTEWIHAKVPALVMTVLGDQSPGSPINAAAPTGAANQLWATETFGVMTKFRLSTNKSLVLQTVGDSTDKGTALTIGPDTGSGSGQWWVFD